MEGFLVMEIEIINENKRDFMDLLFLADEKEDMIERYLDRGTMFALYDNGLKSIRVVTDEMDGNFEIQNLATYKEFQGKGYGTQLVKYVLEYYKSKGTAMYVGTGDTPLTVPFYEHCGFTFSHRLENYIFDHYGPIYEAGILLKDKVYLKKDLRL